MAPEETPDLPGPLAALWGHRGPARRGPRPGLTVERIVAAAIQLADAEGLEGASMGRVAESLGVTTMALYRYLDSKEELLALMADTAIGETRLWEPEAVTEQSAATESAEDAGQPAWRAALEHWCRAQLATTRAHPWLIQVLSTSALLGPQRMRTVETGLHALAGTRLTIAERTEVIGRLSLSILSEATLVAAIDAAQEGIAADDSSTTESSPEPTHPALLDYGSLFRMLIMFADPEEYPEVTAAVESGVFDPDPDEEYDSDLGLCLMLDGVAALIARAEERERAGDDLS